jgi:hypothetical protein
MLSWLVLAWRLPPASGCVLWMGGAGGITLYELISFAQHLSVYSCATGSIIKSKRPAQGAPRRHRPGCSCLTAWTP